MFTKMEQILEAARTLPNRRRLVVAAAQDKDALQAVGDALTWGVVSVTLVGDEDTIKSVAAEVGLDLAQCSLLNEPDPVQAAKTAVAMVSGGQADLVMKGKVGTADILRAVLDKDEGLRTDRLLSHVAVLEVEGYERLFMLTDGAMNIAPDLEQKIQIAQNAVDVANALGIEEPRIAPLTAVEVVNPKMQATIDADGLAKAAARGEIGRAIVSGPIALDGAVSAKSAEIKGITGPVAGNADILLVPMIEAGNVLYKSIIYFARSRAAGVIAGARAPVVLTSRSDSREAKLNSIALGAIIAAQGK
ncbi:MAG: bifunctional enoyl-CoA hydratase/phosphate acetyltransferase [Firmicutes bacterium]|nr:bifunctional enoyl-CoA hydratase/phosphate acetyltransferase [Bacillota bacterium]